MNLERGPSSFNLFFRNHHVCGALQKLGICQVLFGCVDLSKPWQLQTASLQMVGWEPKSFPYFRDFQSVFFPWCFSCWLFCRSSFDEKFDKKCLGEVGFIKTGDPTVHEGCHPKKLWQVNELSPFFVACHVLILSPVRLFCVRG